jgi:murein L,D-transpeptidase YcbB/YkuD
MTRFITILLLVALLFACSNEQKSVKEIQSFEHQNIPLPEKLSKAVSLEYLESIGIPKEAHTFLNAYYKQRNFKSRWIDTNGLTAEGEELKQVLQQKMAIGIPQQRFEFKRTENHIQDEMWLTASSALVLHDLKHGILNYSDTTLKPLTCVSTEVYSQEFEFSDTVDMRRQFLRFGPQDTTYQVLGNGLLKFIDRYPLDTNTFEVPSIKKDTNEAIRLTRLALISKGYFPKSTNDTTGLFDSLRVFQRHNGLKPDGVIGKYTSQALNESTFHKVERILLTMDKLRSQRDFPQKFIHINIPEYKLRFYINDSLKSDHNIVVGTYANQTPQLESTLRRIVVYPYWNVPYSISSKEILPAVKYNSEYLAKHNYKIYRQGQEVDPSTVNWKVIRQNAFPFKVVQDPGPRNSLGVIKFDFYNEHSVYFHDTPAKGLFGADVRAYSHGCMRTQYPIDLAKIILERDSIPYKGNIMKPDSIDSILHRNTDFDYRIKLVDPIPIYIDYITVGRIEQEMIVYLDIYGRDEEYLKILRQKS